MIIPINGRKGRARFGTFVMNIDDANCSIVTNEVPVPGFEDQQTGQTYGGVVLPNDGRTPMGRTDGVDDFSGTLSGYINTLTGQVTAGGAVNGDTIMDLPKNATAGGAWNTPAGAATLGGNTNVGIIQGSIVANVQIYLDKLTANRWAGCTRCLVTRVNYMTKVNDAWKFSIEVKCAGGVITHPV